MITLRSDHSSHGPTHPDAPPFRLGSPRAATHSRPVVSEVMRNGSGLPSALTRRAAGWAGGDDAVGGLGLTGLEPATGAEMVGGGGLTGA